MMSNSRALVVTAGEEEQVDAIVLKGGRGDDGAAGIGSGYLIIIGIGSGRWQIIPRFDDDQFSPPTLSWLRRSLK